MRSRWKTAIVILIMDSIFISSLLAASSQYFRINPNPCTVGEVDGVCMFVWECIKSNGIHLGMCMDGFMFGSCCGHDLADNIFIPPSTPFIPPNKPTQAFTLKPTKSQSSSSKYGTFTIQKQNGNGFLVIRQPPMQNPLKTETTSLRPTISSALNNFHDVSGFELTAAASVSNSWTSLPWRVTTEPNFVTKTKSPWNKTTSSHPKLKPTKRPIAYGSIPDKETKNPITFKPKRPTKPITTQHTTLPVSSTTTASTLMPTNTVGSVLSTSEIYENTIPTEPLSPIRPIPGRVTVSAARSTECGLSKALARPETRIVGGKNAPFGRWPWQSSVRRTSFFGFSSTHRCGGALLNRYFIVTAGHCVSDLTNSQIRVRVGEYDFSRETEQLPYVERSVSKKIVHPQYNFYTYEYDIALVKMDQQLEFAAHIGPICLPATDDLLVGREGVVTGWGRISEGGPLPSVLQEVGFFVHITIHSSILLGYFWMISYHLNGQIAKVDSSKLRLLLDKLLISMNSKKRLHGTELIFQIIEYVPSKTSASRVFPTLAKTSRALLNLSVPSLKTTSSNDYEMC